MMAITTSSSIKVNPLPLELVFGDIAIALFNPTTEFLSFAEYRNTAS